MLKIYKIAFIISLLMSANFYCQNSTIVNYTISDEIISNPERGFSAYRSEPITSWFINQNRENNISVIQRIYKISEFIDQALSEEFLNIVSSDLDIARAGQVKLVLRFSYTDYLGGADAPLDIIQTHISQLQPLFQAHFDVIAYIEAGFIGAWGEWYNSTNGLNNTDDRRTVLFDLLDALPAERCVVVRTPEYKRQIFGIDEPLTFEEAFNGTKRARTGAHNDCFLSSATDFGTYLADNVEGDKTYLNLDNRFVPQGGETCNPSAYSGCDSALTDLDRMHWSVLNKDYHTTVLQGWETEGCMDEIKRRLGYRLVLLDGEYTNQVRPGGEVNINFSIENIGFASPYNPRNVELILRNIESKKRYRANLEDDPRFWLAADTVFVEAAAGILQGTPEGNYELFLHLSDPADDLHGLPGYSIRLANENVWEDSTGFNSLQHFIEINNSAGGNDYSGDLYFTLDNTGSGSESDITIDGIFDDWAEISNFDIDPDEEFAGDALNADVDLLDIWITDDADNVYISYSLSGSFDQQYFYHVLIDVDENQSTGFHFENSYAGVELMIENEVLWKYTGTNGEWAWNTMGSVSSIIGDSANNRIEMSIPKNTLSVFGAESSIDVLFNVNNVDEENEDDYAPDAYQQRSFKYNYLVTSVKPNRSTGLPENYQITSYPNPFNGEVNLVFDVNHSQIKTAGIYDVLGRLVTSYSKDELLKGKLTWNAKSYRNEMVGSGIYMFVLNTEKGAISHKLVLIK